MEIWLKTFDYRAVSERQIISFIKVIIASQSFEVILDYNGKILPENL